MTATWGGASGRHYEYEVYDLETHWNDVPGNYIFARRASAGWIAIYIGQTDSFRNRIADHERISEALRRGATHVHARVNNGGERARRAEEEDLIRLHQPPCNRILYTQTY